MSEEWYARPVLSVTDIERTVAFYVSRLGFTVAWQFADNGKPFVAQLDREGCSLIFSSQWPEKVGKGLMFISLNVEAAPDELNAGITAALDKLRAEFVRRGAPVEDGWWGYKLVVVRDPDGNELYFNYPNTEAMAAG